MTKKQIIFWRRFLLIIFIMIIFILIFLGVKHHHSDQKKNIKINSEKEIKLNIREEDFFKEKKVAKEEKK